MVERSATEIVAETDIRALIAAYQIYIDVGENVSGECKMSIQLIFLKAIRSYAHLISAAGKII